VEGINIWLTSELDTLTWIHTLKTHHTLQTWR